MAEPWRLLTTAEPDAWREALPSPDFVLGSVEYLRLLERQTGLAARLFVLEEAGQRIAYPFLLRPVPGRAQAFDTFTPDYGGPLWSGPEPGPADFPAVFHRFCQDQGIVAEFIHMNPWRLDPALLDPGCIADDRVVVYVDLTQSEEDLWKHSLNSDARRQTRRALEAGVQVRVAATAADALAFHHLHRQTMERLGAASHYFHPPEYFLDLYAALPGQAMFILAEWQGQAIAGGLYLLDRTDVYWHLSAMDMDHAGLRPVNALHFEAIRRLAQAGKRRMLCGGSHRVGDGIFHFKSGFSPLRAPFQVYRRIHDPEAYQSLCLAWSAGHGGAQPSGDYFPAYRSGELATAMAPR